MSKSGAIILDIPDANRRALMQILKNLSQGAFLGHSKSVIVASAPRTRLWHRLKKCSFHAVWHSPWQPGSKKGKMFRLSKRKTLVQLSLTDSESFEELGLLIIIWDVDRTFYIDWFMFGSVSEGLARSSYFFLAKSNFAFLQCNMFWHLVIGDLHTA